MRADFPASGENVLSFVVVPAERVKKPSGAVAPQAPSSEGAKPKDYLPN